MPLRKIISRRKMHLIRKTAIWAISIITTGGLALQASSYTQQSAETSTKDLHQFSQCREHFAQGTPPAIPKAPMQRELCYEAFAILHSGKTKTPMFVAERIDRQSIQAAQKEQRTNRFFADARLPQKERAELGDYKGSKKTGYVRGHMAPAANMPTASAMAQSFSLANIVPQDTKQNAGPWAKIERDTRKYALRAKGSVYVITGPVFAKNSETVGANQVHVPTHLFKLVYDPSSNKSWAYWQSNSHDAKVNPPISYSELEKRLGIALLPHLKKTSQSTQP